MYSVPVPRKLHTVTAAVIFMGLICNRVESNISGDSLEQTSAPDLDRMMSILSRADKLRINTKLVARVPDIFEVDDLDRCDLCVSRCISVRC